MKFEVGDIIFANKYYSWHDDNSGGNGHFHDVFLHDAFKIIEFNYDTFEQIPDVHLHFIRENCIVIMQAKDLETRFDIKKLRKEKLKKIYNEI
jgi:hypothetical protein